MAWLSRLRGGDSSPDLTSVAITLLTIAVVLALGFQIVGADFPTQEELEEEREAFTDYCHTEFGEHADVYRASDSVVARHNGLHCDHDDGMIHRTQIPNHVWNAYKAGDVSADYVTSQLGPDPGLLNEIKQFGGPALLIVGVLAFITWASQYLPRP